MHHERRGSGSPVVLVHGLGSSLRTWDSIAPVLAARREVIAVDLPGFGRTPALDGEVTIATLTDALEGFLESLGSGAVDVVGSSMGARMVLELARRGHAGTTVALAPGGFWDDRQVRIFGATVGASIGLVRRIQPALPLLAGNPVGRTALLVQFSARPWRLDPGLVLTELRGFSSSPSLDEAFRSLVSGPRQPGAPAGAVRNRVVIGWGRRDLVTPASQAARATRAFPDGTLHWFDHCGHFPHWDQPARTAQLILEATS